MKYFYISLLTLGLVSPNLSHSQFDSTLPPTMGISTKIVQDQSKAFTACGNDTLLYALSKATWAEAQTVNDVVFYNKVAQRFENKDTITVYGMCYYAFNDVSGTSPVNITLNMHEVTVDSLPSTVVASASDVVPIGSGALFSDFKRCVTWSTPVVTDKEFFVSIDASGTNEPLGVYRNSAAFDDGGSEILSCVYYDDASGLSHVKWYQQINPGWDFDYLLEPIVSYDLMISSTVSTDTACIGDVVCIQADTISPIFYNKFFNPTVTPIANIDWGDGNMAIGDSACNVYTSDGNYTILHSLTMNGWTTTCNVTHSDSVLIEQAIAGFSYTVSNDTVTFTNSSTGAAGAMWTFDSLGSSSALDTTYVFPSNGSFDIELITWSASGCADTITQTININVGIGENELPQLMLYPNPTQGLLNIVNSVNVVQFDLAIRDMTGKIILLDRLFGSVNTIDLADLAQGQYLVQISNANGMRVDKIQVLK